MAGLFDSILARSGRPDWMPTADAAFPELATPAEEKRDPWSLPRLSDLPQTMLPPHLRKNVGAVDAEAPAVQAAIGNAPAGPAFPPGVMQNVGMLPALNAPDKSPFLNPTEGAMMKSVGVDAPSIPVPMPQPRPAAADLPQNPDPSADGLSLPGAMAQPPASDVSARARTVGAPLAIAPQAPPQAQQGAAPQSPSEIPSVLDRIRTTLGNNSNTLLAIGAGFAGAPNIGQAISRASAAAIPARAADIKQSLDIQSRTYGVKALVEAGVPIQQAIAAQGDPDMKKALIQNYVVNRAKKIVKVGVDRYGADIMAEHDPFTGKLSPIDLSKLTGQNNAAAPTAENDVSGPDHLERLKQQDPAYARKIESMVNGDIPLPNINTKAGSSPQARRELQDALTVDPTLNATDHMGRFQRAQEYSQKGKTGKNVTSINTAITHAGNLHDLIPKLDNFNYFGDVLNPAWSAIRRNLSKDYQTTLGQWETNRQGLSDELEAAMRGGGTSVAGINDWKKTFNEAKSPEQLKGAVQQAMKLLSGRLNEVASSYTEDMKKHRDPVDFIRPENRQLFERLQRGGAAPAVAPAPAAAAAAPVPVSSKTDYDKLPSGATYTAPDGSIRTKK